MSASNPDPFSWMWERAQEILEKADKLQRHLFELRPSRYPQPTWQPPVDIFETPDSLWIVVALPGVEADRVEVTIEAGVLRVRGERALPQQFRQAALHRLEIPHGRFERSLELPAGQFRVGERALHCGCLFLSLRKET